MHQYPFEKLEIWKLSVALTVKICKLTATFPNEEKFGIISQLRRASNSVTANIAEGASRLSNKNKARFFQISYSSLMEVLSSIIISNQLTFITVGEVNDTRKLIEELSNKINAYHKTLK